MAVLEKGQRVSLTKDRPGLKHMQVCLGWDTNMYDGDDFDLDASVFLLTDTGTVDTEKDFVFYNNKHHPTGALDHMGDNRTGSGDGDDEIIKDKTLFQLQAANQQIQLHEAIDDIASSNESDRMLEHVREGVTKAQERATGSRIAYESSMATQERRAEQRAREDAARQLVEDAKRKRG